jgi:hypothetical protein
MYFSLSLNGSERVSKVFSFAYWFRKKFRVFFSSLIKKFGKEFRGFFFCRMVCNIITKFPVFFSSTKWFPSICIFRGMFRTKLRSYKCFSLLRNGLEQNSKLFNLLQTGSERNYECFSLAKRQIYNGMNKNFRQFLIFSFGKWQP